MRTAQLSVILKRETHFSQMIINPILTFVHTPVVPYENLFHYQARPLGVIHGPHTNTIGPLDPRTNLMSPSVLSVTHNQKTVAG